MGNKKIIPDDASGQSYPPQKPRITGIGGGHYYDSKTFTSGYRITTQYSDGSNEVHDIPHPPKIKSTLRGGANSGRGDVPHTKLSDYPTYDSDPTPPYGMKRPKL